MTGDVPLQTGGSNSVNIGKANLPNVKLKVDAVSATIGNHYHYIANNVMGNNPYPTASTYICRHGIAKEDTNASNWYALAGNSVKATVGKTSDNGAGNTGTISPSTENLGNGTPLTINPEHITLKAWKRTK